MQLYSPCTETVTHCRNTLVCDDEAEARHLGFGSTKGDRHKVVTKGGLLIAKAGAMTGGGSGDAAAKAARFDQARLQQLKQVLNLHFLILTSDLFILDLLVLRHPSLPVGFATESSLHACPLSMPSRQCR